MNKLSSKRTHLRHLAAISLLVAATACNGTNVEDPAVEGTGAGGGAAGTGGAAGEAGQAGSGGGGGGPKAKTDKVDLLFVVDNSASMADKQAVLQVAVRDLLQRLANPLCVDFQSGSVLPRGQQPSSAAVSCPQGAKREFPPTNDVHIGVISSSLGGHGADSCSNTPTANYNPQMEDMGHLLRRSATGNAEVPTYEGKGYLDWDPLQKDTPTGESEVGALAQRFGDLVLGAGEIGCGFESTLESWYRFLVDPAPYQKIVPVACSDQDTALSCRAPEGIDQALLGQRADFLRPDSAVAIVMLTDENDCSVVEGGQNYIALQAFSGSGAFHLARATAACDTDPSSAACKSCWEVDTAHYPECAAGWADPDRDDALNLRCYRQKQRFGRDFLQPTRRYVDALTVATFEDGTVNPLFCGDRSADGKICNTDLRAPSLVVLTGIVGVPWQDLAVDPADLQKGYKRATEVDWAAVIGAPAQGVEPSDPFMVEAIDPRSGTNPASGAATTAPGFGSQNGINGGERAIGYRNDLQYACTFALPQPLDCSDPASAMACDCQDSSNQNPVCWNPATQSYGTTQFAAKAYPGTRHLQVLQGIGQQGVVASICPANMTDPNRADYGYRPAMAALGDRLRGNLE